MSKKSIIKKYLESVFFLILFFLLLYHSSKLSFIVLESISLWLTRIVPVLFPFMILQSLIHLLGLDYEIAKIFHPLLGKLYGTSLGGTYCILAGFLFGFPMGAKIASQYYKEHVIEEEEANMLLGFCNNFSPAYYVGFAYPCFKTLLPARYLYCMVLIYLAPLIFGILLHFFHNRKEDRNHPKSDTTHEIPTHSILFLFQSLQKANINNAKSIMCIGIYMIIANILRYSLFILPFQKEYLNIVGSFFEITLGLPILYEALVLSRKAKIYSMFLLLSLGGLSGVLQAMTFIIDSDLSIKEYIRNKILLAGFTLLLLTLILI